MLRPFERCPACGGATSTASRLFTARLLGETCGVLKCDGCGLVYKELALTRDDLAQIYSEDYVHFQNGHATSAPDVNSATQKLRRCRGLLKTARVPEEIRLLDVGCGSGGFVEIALRQGYRAEGIDPNLPAGLNHTHLMRKSSAEVAPCSYDMALLLNVAEHLVEPRQMFSEVRRLLKPDGVMLLTCPYGDSLARRIHRERWGHLLLDEHLLFWTPRSLQQALRGAGFQGRFSYRIAGSPFPYGRGEASEASSCEQTDVKPKDGEVERVRTSWQSKVWQAARLVQGHEHIANLVRSLIHYSRTGDYLEYAIAAT